MAVVREDTVKLTFDYDDKGAVRAESQMDDLLENTQKLGGPQGTGKAESGFKNATEAAKKFGNTSLDKLSSGMDSILKSVGKIAKKLGGMAVKGLTAGAAATTAGLTALGTQAVKGYADYEQLVGGVETLFGSSASSVDDFTASIGKSTEEIKAFQRANGLAVDGIIGPQTTAAIQKAYSSMEGASKTVITNANNAYKNAGLSANDYMETVTSFSASLVSSLGGDTAKAADYADRAITDMADNSNKMGTDISHIQDAYQGFAKQNYTMLDNLSEMGALAA